MLVPGLVILFLFLMIPLLRVLVPSVFTGDYPFSAYVDFFKDEYYRKIFLRSVRSAVITTFVCMGAVARRRISSAAVIRRGEDFSSLHRSSR